MTAISKLATAVANNRTLTQIDVNKTEAAHRTMFVADWRPAIGRGVIAIAGWLGKLVLDAISHYRGQP